MSVDFFTVLELSGGVAYRVCSTGAVSEVVKKDMQMSTRVRTQPIVPDHCHACGQTAPSEIEWTQLKVIVVKGKNNVLY